MSPLYENTRQLFVKVFYDSTIPDASFFNHVSTSPIKGSRLQLCTSFWKDPQLEPVGSKISILSSPGPKMFLLPGPVPKISDMMNFS